MFYPHAYYPSILILSFSLLFLSTRCKLEKLQAMLMFPAEACCCCACTGPGPAFSCCALRLAAAPIGRRFALRLARLGNQQHALVERAPHAARMHGEGRGKQGHERVGGGGHEHVDRARGACRGIGWLFNHPVGRLDFRSG
jgi:hypothetical protein